MGPIDHGRELPPVPGASVPATGREPPKPAPERAVSEAAPEPAPSQDLLQVREEMRQFVQQLSRVFTGLSSRLEFGFVRDPQMIYVRVVDRSTNRTVKVLPMPEMLELKQKLDAMNARFLDHWA
jgi:uncharacterized FlaG/YvyC family protein